MSRRLIPTVVLLALAVAFPAHAQSGAQQPDPAYQALALEWQALALQQHHAEEAINRLVASYEARLTTAMDWLKRAQQADDKH